MTKQRGPVLQMQAARTTKKTVLALAAVLGLQVAALADVYYANGWKWSGECWCDHRNDPGSNQDRSDATIKCLEKKCDTAYPPPSHDNDSCIAGAADQAKDQVQNNHIPACKTSPAGE